MITKLSEKRYEIEDLSPICGLDNLIDLDLSWVHITDEQKAELNKALPGCNIKYDNWNW